MNVAPPVIKDGKIALATDERRGRTILTVLFSAWMIVCITVLGFLVIVGGVSALPISLVICGSTFVLFYFVWLGHDWARWLTIALFGAGPITWVLALLARPIVLFFVLFGLSFTVFSIFAFCLIFSKPVAQFLSHQRTHSKAMTL